MCTSRPNTLHKAMNPNYRTLKHSIIQWNCWVIRTSMHDITNMIKIHQPMVLAFQEIKLPSYSSCKIPGYTAVRRDGHFNRTPHGRVAIYIHNSTPYAEVQLTTNIQAVAIRRRIENYIITICNLYIAGSHQFEVREMIQLIEQLPCPVLVLGDFNAHHIMWGSNRTDPRGIKIENIV